MSICLCHIKKPAEKELPKSKVDVYVRVFDGECPLTLACATYLLIMRSWEYRRHSVNDDYDDGVYLSAKVEKGRQGVEWV